MSAADTSGARTKGASVLDLVSHSSIHTERLGERLGRAARAGDVLALWGELGTGKTVLARGVAAGLGIDADEVTSPTFIILHEHPSGRLPLFHLDLYRLAHADLGSTGWEEAVNAGGVTVIEWPDRAGDDLPQDRLDVRLEHIAETKRRVVLEATGPRSRALIEGIQDDIAGA